MSIRLVFVCETCRAWNAANFMSFGFGSNMQRRQATFDNLRALIAHYNENIIHTINIELEDDEVNDE